MKEEPVKEEPVKVEPKPEQPKPEKEPCEMLGPGHGEWRYTWMCHCGETDLFKVRKYKGISDPSDPSVYPCPKCGCDDSTERKTIRTEWDDMCYYNSKINMNPPKGYNHEVSDYFGSAFYYGRRFVEKKGPCEHVKKDGE